MKEHRLSIQKACQILKLSQTAYYYQPELKENGDVILHLKQLANEHSRYRSRKLFQLLRRQGKRWNHKRVYRVYCSLQLNLRKKPKKRLPARISQPLSQPVTINSGWSLDFMSDVLMNGQRFRTVNIIDDFNREGLGIDINKSLPAQRVVDYLDVIVRWRGYPSAIRVDNGSENISSTMLNWANQHAITLKFIEPGKPAQNGFIERFNRNYREEVLDMYLFDSLDHVRQLTDQWLTHYNYHRPHEALNHRTPIEYRVAYQQNISPSSMF